MSSRIVLLHFGNDVLLSEARQQVLEDAGYDVMVADTQAEVMRVLRTRRVGAVIACHSVSPGELESTVRQIRQLSPRLPVIAVHVGGLIGAPRALADGFIDGLRGPEHLLSQVASFVTRDVVTRDTTAAAS